MAVSIGNPVARGGWLLALVVVVVASGCSSTSTTCPTGQTSCGGVCVDLASNPLYCGTCNVSCNQGHPASMGSAGARPARPPAGGLRRHSNRPRQLRQLRSRLRPRDLRGRGLRLHFHVATVALCSTTRRRNLCRYLVERGPLRGLYQCLYPADDLLHRDLPVCVRNTSLREPGPPLSAPTSQPTRQHCGSCATSARRVDVRGRELPADLRGRLHPLRRFLCRLPERPRHCGTCTTPARRPRPAPPASARKPARPSPVAGPAARPRSPATPAAVRRGQRSTGTSWERPSSRPTTTARPPPSGPGVTAEIAARPGRRTATGSTPTRRARQAGGSPASSGRSRSSGRTSVARSSATPGRSKGPPGHDRLHLPLPEVQQIDWYCREAASARQCPRMTLS